MILILGLIISIAIIVALWPQIKRFLSRFDNAGRVSATESQLRKVDDLDDKVCSICLTEPKKLRVSATCGHSYCGKCLLQMYDHTNQKIVCPLCRKQVTTIFKCFDERQPQAQIADLKGKIHEYNARFADNRGIARTIIELPYVLTRIGRFIFSPQFVALLVASPIFLRGIVFCIIYVLSPFDLIPEYLIGIAGYLDDILAIMTVIAIVVSRVGLVYIRNRGE